MKWILAFLSVLFMTLGHAMAQTDFLEALADSALTLPKQSVTYNPAGV